MELWLAMCHRISQIFAFVPHGINLAIYYMGCLWGPGRYKGHDVGSTCSCSQLLYLR